LVIAIPLFAFILMKKPGTGPRKTYAPKPIDVRADVMPLAKDAKFDSSGSGSFGR
jgi:hypothetical protein